MKFIVRSSRTPIRDPVSLRLQAQKKRHWRIDIRLLPPRDHQSSLFRLRHDKRRGVNGVVTSMKN